MKTLSPFLAAAAVLVFTAASSAVPISVAHENLPGCDDLLVPRNVDELGINFPADERIRADHKQTDLSACPDSDQGIANQLVTIFNTTVRSFDNLWYVGDPETRFSNVDGLVEGQRAFKIDRLGVNRPLVFESLTVDGVFEPGERWDFIVDGYANLNSLPASAFYSIGAVGLASGGDPFSSASVIATPVIPEPSSALVALLGLVASTGLRRR
jgi:hypothetical protein